MAVPNKYRLTGVHGANRYLWSKLQTELLWTHQTNVVPIVPAGQQPELNADPRPYIVYNYVLQPSGDNWWTREEQVSYTVFSKGEDDVRGAINLIVDLFDRRDDSAKELNNWIQVNGTPDNKKFDYKYTYINSASGAQPPVQEGGRYDGLAIVRYAYTVDLDPITGHRT